MDVRHCQACGARLATTPPTRCGACGRGVFVDAAPSGSAVVVDGSGDRFLAVRRAREPGAGLWDLPGGFCDGDHPEAAAVREVREETGLDVVVTGLVGIYTDSYTYQGLSRPTLNVYYFADIVGDSAIAAAPDEVAAVAWHRFDAAPAMAFAHQAQVLADAVALLQ